MSSLRTRAQIWYIGCMRSMSYARLAIRHAISRVLHKYADLRIGATEDEKRCYKHSDSILLTFDDYGSSAQVNDILAILQTKNVRAMFFLQGDWAAEHPDLVAA